MATVKQDYATRRMPTNRDDFLIVMICFFIHSEAPTMVDEICP